MSNFIKLAKKILREKNSKQIKTNPKYKYLVDTYNFYKKHKVKIIYSNIDFLTCKLYKISPFLLSNLNLLISVYNPLEIYNFDLKNIRKFTFLENFHLVNVGLVFGNQKQLYNIYDNDLNKIGQLVLKVENFKNNKNVINSLELSGLFFKCYGDYLNDFLKFFGISKIRQDVVKRIDYCIDLLGIEVFELLRFLKTINKKGNLKNKNVNALSATDKKKILEEKDFDFKYGKIETFKSFKTSYNDLKIYDKILDILDNYKKRKVNGKNPYKDYLDSDYPITRIELKKKSESFIHMDDNSLEYILNNIDKLFFDYLKRYFDIDLSLFIGENLSLNGKKNFLAKKEKEKSLYHSMIMAGAYLNNIKELAGDKELYKFLFKKYPDLENINFLDLFDDLEISDFFVGISDNL